MLAQSDSSLDFTVVVAEREFLVNRKALIDGNSYFRALLDGTFKEAGANRVELKGLSEPDAFAVVLDSILKKRVNLRESSRVLSSAFELSDMLNDETFPKVLESELFKNWADLENAHLILNLAETLKVRNSLLLHIFHLIRNNFITKGRSLFFNTKDSIKNQDCSASVIHVLSDLVVDLFGTDEASVFCFADFDDVRYFYVKGVISWVIDKKLNEESIRNVVRCLGLRCLNEKSLLELIAEQEESQQRFLLEREVKCYLETTRFVFRHTVLHLCVGWQNQLMETYRFNLKNWTWELIEFKQLHVTPFREYSGFRTPIRSEERIINEISFLTEIDILFPEFQPGEVRIDLFAGSYMSTNKSVYTSGQYAGDGHHNFFVYELKYDETTFSLVLSAEIPGQVTGCHLLRLFDFLHGFVTYTLDDGNFTVSHFSLQRNREENIWLESDFRLEPLLTDLGVELTPVAAVTSRKGILVTFRHGKDYIWLADYNLKSGALEPLAHIAMPRKQGKKAMQKLGLYPRRFNFGTECDKICTFKTACCSDLWKPFFNVVSLTGISGDHSICPYLSNFRFCAENIDHVPKFESVLSLCSFPGAL